ncbi:MAG: hypothetical protein COW00_12690 [Bdellovibrio sp. CG12_big_fil_rev_8_21_14_0_65_39_13]|nr:MAG: hypothetical protein COW78_06980 [Bdellovibrio sp. CG22_combo_CG10-13_8_21_14_all_39_27]PIQ59041.1 MAG: hypothetical protein COW00_12690 [Bdellovibrio sp. CG12_big_fil_rev_8_21_14_0_65_39_13]PIR33017.1 MAG: hypothetical protein COV37_18150 [Bdellovibrio sp. CG11_big_fil_rev_8_21_14_0_20_39_38]
MLNNDLKDFIQEVVAIMVATRDDRNVAHGTRAYGAVVNNTSDEITFYVNAIAFKNLQAHLIDNQELALAFGRPTDYRAIQVKGTYLSHRHADARDQLIIERYLHLFADIVEKLGGDSKPYKSLPALPAIAINMRIKSVFSQTPGSSSGESII